MANGYCLDPAPADHIRPIQARTTWCCGTCIAELSCDECTDIKMRYSTLPSAPTAAAQCPQPPTQPSICGIWMMAKSSPRCAATPLLSIALTSAPKAIGSYPPV